MEMRGERRSPESQAARALVAAREEAELMRRKLEELDARRVPAVVRRRRFARRLAEIEEEERRQLEMLGGTPGALH